MKKKKAKRCRHVFGEMVRHSDPSDGNYQVCKKCRGTRFEGERNIYKG